VEDDQRALLFVESSDAPLDLVAIRECGGRVRRERLDDGHRALIESSALVPPRLLVTGVHQEPAQPGFEAVRVSEGGEVAPGGDERLLGGIGRPFVVSQDEPRHGIELVDPAAHQLVERLPITRHRALDEITSHRPPVWTRHIWSCSQPSGAARASGVPTTQVADDEREHPSEGVLRGLRRRP
jgi:hypothetical protein